jgi:hypothetical protein
LAVYCYDYQFECYIDSNVYLNSNWAGYTGQGITVQAGYYEVGVDDPIYNWEQNTYMYFWYFVSGTGGNPTGISITGNTNLGAAYW